MNFEWLLGRRCTAVEAPTEHATCFEFEDAAFYVETLWRISLGGRLHRVLGDDGQRYGLDRPIDARAEAREVLVGRAITGALVDLLRGDVRLELEGDCVLEFLTDSHYEPWQLTAPGRNYVASAGGAVLDVSQFATRKAPPSGG